MSQSAPKPKSIEIAEHDRLLFDFAWKCFWLGAIEEVTKELLEAEKPEVPNTGEIKNANFLPSI